jgi:hypothetical protein
MGPSTYFNIKYLFSFLHPYSKGDLGGVADLYDPKDSAKSVHRDINKLRVKLALSKDSSI